MDPLPYPPSLLSCILMYAASNIIHANYYCACASLLACTHCDGKWTMDSSRGASSTSFTLLVGMQAMRIRSLTHQSVYPFIHCRHQLSFPSSSHLSMHHHDRYSLHSRHYATPVSVSIFVCIVGVNLDAARSSGGPALSVVCAVGQLVFIDWLSIFILS